MSHASHSTASPQYATWAAGAGGSSQSMSASSSASSFESQHLPRTLPSQLSQQQQQTQHPYTLPASRLRTSATPLMHSSSSSSSNLDVNVGNVGASFTPSPGGTFASGDDMGGSASKRQRTEGDGHSRAPSSSDHDGSPGAKANGSSAESSRVVSGSGTDGPKRVKTARACDSCRRKKIRCDVIDDGSPPPGDPNNGNGGLTCAHCRQYGFNCTFFLPITETRFKKKREREAEEAAAARSAAAGRYPGAFAPMNALPRPGMPTPFGMPHAMPLAHPANISAAQEWPPINQIQRFQARWDSADVDAAISPKTAAMQIGPVSSAPGGLAPVLSATVPPGDRLERLPPPQSTSVPPGADVGPPPDARVLGPTSLAYIVHSTAFVPGSAIEAHDLKHSQTFEVGASGDGIIKLNRSRQRNPSCASSEDEDGLPQIPDAIRGRLAGDVAEKLINSYFEKIGYLWPVITKSEFLHLTQPPSLLFYSICGVAALDRNVPLEVLSAVRIGLNAIFKDSDVLSNSSANTVKALLILSLHGDVHGSSNIQSGTKMWNRLGAGLRMAQDLGLHRDASGRDDIDEFAHFLEQKRRIWGACVTSDRLVSIALGHPLAIDLTDCDVRLPSPYEIRRYPTDLPAVPGVERPFAFNTEMLKLSILFGRVQKTIYSPTGLMKATDEEITGLLNDIDQWREVLPDELKFVGPHSPPSAGILHLCFACIQMLFFRVFMRISYSCPQHLKFSLTIERMSQLIKWSRESIDWMAQSGAFYLDTMQFTSYALVFCATVQYHSWVRRGDEEGLNALGKLRDIVTRGRRAGDQKQDLTLRVKIAEIISMLCEAAQGQWANTPSTGNLNPTAGVVNRRTADSVRGIVWKDAPGRPGGGTYEASDTSLLLSDLPSGTIILGPKKTPALVRTSANGWQPVPGVLPEQTSSQDTDPTSADANLPDLSNFTYLGGQVWQDDRGRPVDRRGSGLMVVLPQDQQNQQRPSNAAALGGLNGVGAPQAQYAHANSMNVNPLLNAAPAANGTVNGVQAGDGNLLGDMFSGSDPMMLNDPLMGMLDWQAWQSYLAPFGTGAGGAAANNINSGNNTPAGPVGGPNGGQSITPSASNSVAPNGQETPQVHNVMPGYV